MRQLPLVVFVSALAAGVGAQQQWTERSFPVQPPAALGAALAHDSLHDVLVLFGGQAARTSGSPVLSDETWVYDGMAWTLASPSVRPRPRSFHGMTGDDQGNVWVFGGIHAQGRALDDLWRWNGSDWQQVQRGYVVPSRSEPAMASYGRGVFVFGGFDPRNGSVYGDTWVASSDGRWSEQPGFGAPAPRRAAGAVETGFFSGLSVLVHGGTDAGGTAVFDDTWVWRNGSWQEVANAGGPARAGGALVYDPESRQVFLHGGHDGTGFVDDLWRFDGSHWWPVSPGVRPPARAASAVALDPVRHRIVAVGGESAAGVGGAHWEYTSTFPVRSFGVGCSTDPGVAPELRPRAPAIGGNMLVEVVSPTRFRDMLLLIGLSDRSWNGVPLPLSLGGLGLSCDLLVGPLVTEVTSIPTGTRNLGVWVPLPGDVALSGLPLFLQAAVLDSGAVLGVSQGARVELY